MDKMLIVPIVALCLILVKRIAGVEFSNVEMDMILEGFLDIITLSGILMNPKNEK